MQYPWLRSRPPTWCTDTINNEIQCHPNVLKPGLGVTRGITAKLEKKPDVEPILASPVLCTLQEAVEGACHQLESKYIVEKVEFSLWATPMVHVPKADGTTWSCGDYAVTVNPRFNIPQYPISLPDYVFVKPQGSKRSSKLDSVNDHQKLPLEPDSQHFVTINTHCGPYWNKRLPFGIPSSPAIFSGPWTSFFKVLSMLQSFYMTFWSWDRMMNSTFRVWTLFSVA